MLCFNGVSPGRLTALSRGPDLKSCRATDAGMMGKEKKVRVLEIGPITSPDTV